MPMFRKKPVVIEAEQFTEERAFECLDESKAFAFGLHVSGSWHSATKKLHRASISIRTTEGTMRADIGDWIICGVNGELYPCKPDVFEKSYDPVQPQVTDPKDLGLKAVHREPKGDSARVEQLTRERDAALVKWQAANSRAIAAELRSEDNL